MKRAASPLFNSNLVTCLASSPVHFLPQEWLFVFPIPPPLFPCFLFGPHFKSVEQSSSDCWPVLGLPCPLAFSHAHPITLTSISLTPFTLDPPTHATPTSQVPTHPQSSIITFLPPSFHQHQNCPPPITSSCHAATFNRHILSSS